MMDTLPPPQSDFGFSHLNQDFSRVSEFTDTFVKERLGQAGKTNKNWCSFYNKLFNVGWIVAHNSIFFFQYLSNQNTVNRSFIEFPKNQRIESPEQVKIFKKDKDLYAIVIYPSIIQIAKILCSDNEKDLVEIIRFPRADEKIVAVSEAWDEISSVYLTVLTNKKSLYLIQIEPRVVDLRIEFSLTLHILNRKTKLLQKIKSYIAPDSDLQGNQAFCHMIKRNADVARSSVRTYDIFSYADGKLEFFSLTLEQKNGKYFPSSHLYKWEVNIRSQLEGRLSEILYQGQTKLWDIDILDFSPQIVKSKGQVLLKFLVRVLYVNHSFLEGCFIYIAVALDDNTGETRDMEHYQLDQGFKINFNELQNRDQIFYGRIISNAENDDVYLCVHFSLRSKEGMIEIEEAQQTQTNLFIELKSKEVSGLTIKEKILGAGNYFDYEHNEEDVLLVITETELIKMKVLKHINLSTGTPQKLASPSVLGQSFRNLKSLRFSTSDILPETSEEMRSFSLANKLSSQFREMLGSARDNLPSVKIEVDQILKHNNPSDVWKGLQNFTNEILRTKNRNLVLVSTYIPTKSSKKKESKSEASDILHYEMKKKLKVLNAWIDFLKKFGIWNLEHPIRDLVYSNKEKLIAAIRLREEQITLNNHVPEDEITRERKNLLFNAILECIHKWQLRANVASDYYNNDVFYTKIENFPNFITSLVTIHQKYVNERNDFQHLSFINQIIIGIFTSLYEERDAHHYERLSLWTQDEELLLHISSLLFLTIEALKKAETETETFKQNLAGLGYILIREYNNIIKLWPEEKMWDDKLVETYNALLGCRLFTQAGKYAEEFCHMDIISRLYYEFDHDHHIRELFVRWSNQNFLEQFIDSYLQYLSRNHGRVKGPFKLFLEFEEFNDQITRYISQKYPQLAWIFLIKNGQFFQGENIIRKVAPNENYLRNRLVEASTGRLCTSFSSKEASSDYEKLLRIDLVQDQSNIKPDLAHPESMINYLLTQSSQDSNEKIKKCIKILSNIPSNPYYNSIENTQYQKLLSDVVAKAIEFDKKLLRDIKNSLDMGQPADMINHKVSQTCSWNNFDQLLILLDREGIELDTLINHVTNNDENIRIVFQQMRTIKESEGLNKYSEINTY